MRAGRSTLEHGRTGSQAGMSLVEVLIVRPNPKAAGRLFPGAPDVVDQPELVRRALALLSGGESLFRRPGDEYI